MMSMRMEIAPRQFLGLACTVCGVCPGAGQPDGHADDTYIENMKAAAISSMPEPINRQCPKCGAWSVAEHAVVQIYQRVYIRKADSKAVFTAGVRTVLASHIPLWEAQKLVQEFNAKRRHERQVKFQQLLSKGCMP